MIAIRLQALLDERSMSQREFARITGMRQETVSRYCRGYIDRLEIAHIDRICKALKASPCDWIVFSDDSE